MEELIEEGTVVRRRRSHTRAWLICIVIVIAAIGLPVAIAIIVTLIRAAPDPAKYAIVFDADSAGSRMHIYKWDGTKTHRCSATTTPCIRAASTAMGRTRPTGASSPTCTSNPTQTTIPHPCAPRGTPLSLTYESLFESSCTDSEKPASHKSGNVTFLGSGDPTACATLVATLFDRLFEGNRRPHLRGLFLALSAFFRTYEFYHFKDATSWTTLEWLAESVDAFCTKTWDEVLTTPDAGQRTLELSQFCFDGVYVIETLKALGFDSTTWTNVIATDTMKGTPVGLSLGFMLAEINAMPATVLTPDQNQGDYNYHYGVR